MQLHNTYKHDLKTYTSNEGRCQRTAGHFLKGFLDYEGEVAPIMATLLTRDELALSIKNKNSIIKNSFII